MREKNVVLLGKAPPVLAGASVSAAWSVELFALRSDGVA